MNSSITLAIQLTSIIGILIPIGVGLMRVRTAARHMQLFLLFLFIGFATDVSMFYLYHIGQTDYLLVIFNVYSVIESITFYWFVRNHITQPVLKKVLTSLLVLTPLFWFFFIVCYPSIFFTEDTASQVFDTIYEIGVAFLSGYALLKLVERDDLALRSAGFWILTGIFFYCFCTFFIMSFLNTFLSMHIWFLNNIINFITYIFYAVGLWFSARTQVQPL